MQGPGDCGLSRRDLMKLGAAATAAPMLSRAQDAAGATEVAVTLNVNGQQHALKLDTRTTLLDALREHLQLTGTKKGCDHGQCGACTVLVNGRRINSCLTLAVMHPGDRITTIEGLGTPTKMHPDAGGLRDARRLSMRLLHARDRSVRRWRCCRKSSRTSRAT